MSESRVSENGVHGLNGGGWGQLAITSEIQRSTKVTTPRRATVSRRRDLMLNQRPTSPIGDLAEPSEVIEARHVDRRPAEFFNPKRGASDETFV
jgi:hypothetical protein